MILDEIVARRRQRVAEDKQRVPARELEEQVAVAAPCRDFPAALAAPGISVIAEVKRSSPSKGAFAPDLDAAATARAYERGGAAAVSVLTEPDFFRGSLEDLAAVKAAISLPALRKDFIFDPYQLLQARAAGADAVLLMASVLKPAELGSLLRQAHELGLSCLVEAHDEGEVEAALRGGGKVIGVNNRDMRTFNVDLATTERLRRLIPPDRLMVSESGVHTRADLDRLAACGVDAVLVGEALVRSGDPARLLGELLGLPAGDSPMRLR